MTYLDKAHSPASEARSSGYDPGETFRMSASTKTRESLRSFVTPLRGAAPEPRKAVSTQGFQILWRYSHDILALCEHA